MKKKNLFHFRLMVMALVLVVAVAALVLAGSIYRAKVKGKEVTEIEINIEKLEPNEWVEFGPYNFEQKEAWSVTVDGWEGSDAIHAAYGLDREHITSDYELNEEIKGMGVSMSEAGAYYFYIHNTSDSRIENLNGRLRLYISKYPE